MFTRVLDNLGRTVVLSDLVNKTSTGSAYDSDNRLLSQSFVGRIDAPADTSKNYTVLYNYYSDTTDTTSSATGSGALASVVLTPAANTQGVTPAATTTGYTYQYWDSAQQRIIIKTQGGQSTISTLSYDVNGALKTHFDQGTQRTRSYITNASGQVLQRNSSGTVHFYFYADGHRIGDVGNSPDDQVRVSYAEQLARNGRQESIEERRERYMHPGPQVADFDQNYEPINDNYPGNALSSYTVRSNGETLRSIAQALWGDSSMWYLIAEANGILKDGALVAGQVILIPNKVTNIHNNASTWRPYSAGEAIGATDPSWPQESGSVGDGGGAESPGSDADAGDRTDDYAFIDAWEGYHDAMIGWWYSGSGAPPISPNNRNYGSVMDTVMRTGRLPRNTTLFDVRGPNAPRTWHGDAWEAARAAEVDSAINGDLAGQTQGQGPWSSVDYRNGSDIESDNFNPASAYGYRNGSDVESDAFSPAMAYGYRNGSDVESDRLSAAWALAKDRTMLNAAERAARPEAYMSIEQLPRVTVSGVSQATRENANETQRLLNRSQALPIGADGLRIGPTVDRARAQVIYTGDIDAARFATEYRARIANGSQASSWDGVTRLSPVEGYLAQVRGGLDAVHGENWHFQAAQGVPDAVLNEAGGLVLGAGLKLANSGWNAARGSIYGEQALLRAELNSTLRAAGEAELPGATSLDGLSPGAPVQTYWPPKSGFYGPTNTETLGAGYRFSRYGGFIDESGAFKDFGNFVAPVEVPFGARALPESSLGKPLSTYEIIKPVPDVLTGQAAPWFNQIGQGIQHQLPMPINDLIDQGYIKLINRSIPPKP